METLELEQNWSNRIISNKIIHILPDDNPVFKVGKSVKLNLNGNPVGVAQINCIQKVHLEMISDADWRAFSGFGANVSKGYFRWLKKLNNDSSDIVYMLIMSH
jgi:hypothetical protein